MYEEKQFKMTFRKVHIIYKKTYYGTFLVKFWLGMNCLVE